VPETRERTVIDAGPRDRGPTLVVVAGLHGNEPAGVEALERVAAALGSRAGRLRGRVVGVVGNRTALARGLRFVDRDLNRAWTAERVEALRNGGAAVPGRSLPAAEDAEQRELSRALDEVLAGARGPVFVLDLHTTSGEGGPFSTVADTLQNRTLALTLPVPLVLGLEELVEGTLHEYLGRRGCVTLAFESGQHQEAEAAKRAEAAIWLVAAAAGMLPEAAMPELTGARKTLARDGRGLPRVLEMRHRHPVSPDDGFRMRPGYRNFQRVQRGEALADDRAGEVRATESARILMPLYQVQGDDGFFVVREFRPFWLHLSHGLRRAGADRWVQWLPGVRRHPSRSGALVVNRRVARWLALPLLHLLGYRRHEDDGHRLVVLRQEVDGD
jgi:succinylglutamate desuccinylase